MESSLKESEDRYRSVSELTSDVAYAVRVEANGDIVREWVTGAFSRIISYTPEEVDEFELFHVVYEKDVPVAEGQLESLLHGDAETVEYRIVTKTGEIRWLRDHAQPVWDEELERTVRIYGAIQDITETKRAEGMLQIQRDLSTALGEATDILQSLELLLETSLMVEGIDSGGVFRGILVGFITC